MDGTDIDGVAGHPNNTFAGKINLGIGRTLIFTVEVTTTLKQQDPCNAVGTVPMNSWARASKKGFAVPADVDTAEEGATAHNLGRITAIGTTECPFGAVTITNTLTSPIDPSNGAPGIPLSTDPMEFIATWKNTSGQAVTLPSLGYTYVLPSDGLSHEYEDEADTTQATWTCTSSTGGSCPAPVANGSATLISDGTGEPQGVFSYDNVTLAAGQELTFKITLATTLRNCTPPGLLPGTNLCQPRGHQQ